MEEAQTLRSMVRDDSYRVLRVLSEGPTSRTELVTLDGEGPLVRKRIPLELANAEAWAALLGVEEPLLPHIESLYRMPDQLVVVYDYVKGESLSELVANHGALAPQVATQVIGDLCHAAGVLHQRGIVHRDIKPGNVIVDREGRAHLIDLGIARRQTNDQAHDTRVLGTWGYAAPEQFGFAESDARSDVYALGRLLGFLLSGKQPDDPEYEELLRREAEASPKLAEVVAQATAFEPSARYQSAAELQAALEAAVAPQRSGPKTKPLELFEEAKEAAREAKRSRSERVRPARPAASATSGARAPVDTGARRFGDAPLAARIAAIAFWFASGVWVLLMGSACFDAVTKHQPEWGVGEIAISLITCGMALAVSKEVYACIKRMGPYGAQRHAVYILLRQIAIIFGVAFVLMAVFALLFSAAQG